MKPILHWIKGHIVIVIMVVLMLGLLPTAYIISMKLNVGIAKRQSQAYNEEKQKIDRAKKVTYSLPRISSDEAESSLTETRAPNDFVTNFYLEQRQVRLAQVQEVTDAAMNLNRADHRPVVESFPPPPGADNRANVRATLDLGRAITGEKPYNQSAYEILFDRMGGGDPPSREELGRTIGDLQDREMEALRDTQNNPGSRTPNDAVEEVQARLVERRLAEYRRQADQVCFYGSANILYGGGDSSGGGARSLIGRGGSSSSAETMFPSSMPTDPPSLTQAYLWQWDYWVVEDLLRAIVKANSDATGDPLPAPLSVVKRLESISIDPFAMPKAEAGASDDMDAMGMGSMGLMNTGSRGDEPAAGRVTLTGRKQGDGPYDVRHATITVVVSSSKLPSFLSAIRTTNLMTVTDLDIMPVDVWSDLSQGYFYGEENVVRATIGVESVWLREWTKYFMPEPVRQALGVTIENNAADESENDG